MAARFLALSARFGGALEMMNASVALGGAGRQIALLHFHEGC